MHNTSSQPDFKKCMSHSWSQIFLPFTFMTEHNIHRSHLPWTMTSSQRQPRTSRVNLPSLCNISQLLYKLFIGIITQKSNSHWFQIYRTIPNICLNFSRLSWKHTDREWQYYNRQTPNKESSLAYNSRLNICRRSQKELWRLNKHFQEWCRIP